MGKLKNSLTATIAQMGINFLDSDPEKNLGRMLGWADKVDRNGTYRKQREFLRKIVEDKDNKWHKFVLQLWGDTDPKVRKALMSNFFVNSVLIGRANQKAICAEKGINLPWTLLIDPTTACNKHCTGCWAAEYGHALNLTYEQLASIVKQGKELGIYFYLFTGGEPMVRKHDIIRLCKENPDCEFLSFTNGSLVDEEFCKEMLEVGNLTLTLSVEGFAKQNDSRRGEGSFEEVMHTMELLHQHKLLFGVSVCYTSKNTETVISDDFLRMLQDTGCKYIWYFHYMPVGNDASPDLLPSPQQRELIYRKVREVRSLTSKSDITIFPLDFQNDGEFVGGCIAGARNYAHINANGDVEPCVFIHYSGANIKEKSLYDCLTQPLFLAYKEHQAFNKNMLRPCPMLENPGWLPKMVKETGAKSTDLQSPEDVDHLVSKTVEYAKNWKPTADRLWKESGHTLPGDEQ